jgi:hypothetical protein
MNDQQRKAMALKLFATAAVILVGWVLGIALSSCRQESVYRYKKRVAKCQALMQCKAPAHADVMFERAGGEYCLCIVRLADR